MTVSDPAKLAALLRQLEGGELFLDANHFLDGNEDLGSLGCNLVNHPGMSAFRKTVKAISERPDVAQVYVEIMEVMEAPDWPFTDTIYVCTAATQAEVATWFKHLGPDDVLATDEGPVPAKPGFQWWAVWWD